MPRDNIEHYTDEPSIPGKVNSNGLFQRSEMFQEIFSTEVGFAEKWALLIFLAVLLFLIASTWFIRYPDIIETQSTLTALNAPKEIVSRIEGRLVKMLRHNNENIKKGEVIGWIESTADHHEVLLLSQQLDSIIRVSNPSSKSSSVYKVQKYFRDLGELQPEYQTFITALQQYEDYKVNGFYLHKKMMLENNIKALLSENLNLHGSRDLTEQDLSLAEESYKMNKSLAEQKVLSKEEFRQEQSKFLNKQMTIPQMDASLLSNEIQIREKQNEVEVIDHEMNEQKLIFQQVLQSFKSSVDDWKTKYIIQAPIDGQLVFTNPLQENQFLKQDKLLGYISPADSHFYTETYLPQRNFGKVDTGLQVQLRFDAYPYQEDGFVEGRLSYVSNVAADSGFYATIRLTNGMVTANRKQIPYKNGLTAHALIITKNMRLLERLCYGFRKKLQQ